MGEFKPMVKMMTTEPTVELKLKKGGAVAMKKGGSAKAKKMMDGGMSGMRAPAPMPMPVGRAMARPAPRMPMRPARPARPMMKEGGETKAEHAKEMKVASEFKKHKSMPASKAHKGLKTGGVVKGQGGYKTGGVVNGQGGYKTGGVVNGQGGYKKGGMPMKDGKPAFLAKKKGGAAKKYAKGGSVNNSGKAKSMPQGHKKPSTPVSINQLSGTFKKGGEVITPAEKRLTKVFDKENAPAMKAAKSKDVEIYSKYGKQMRYGGSC